MDKILGIFTTIFIGIPLAVISFIISRSMDDDERRNTKQSTIDLDMRLYVPSRCRDRRRGDGCAISGEKTEAEERQAETK